MNEKILSAEELEHRRLIRLLRLVDAYTGNGSWIKRDMLYLIVFNGINRGTFEDYDCAPSIVSFQGVKHFVLISQEALLDIDLLFRKTWIEKMLLSSYYYSTQVGLRISKEGKTVLGSDPPDNALDSLLYCDRCKSKNPLDYRIRTGKKELRGAAAYCSKCDEDEEEALYRNPETRIEFFYNEITHYASEALVFGEVKQ